MVGRELATFVEAVEGGMDVTRASQPPSRSTSPGSPLSKTLTLSGVGALGDKGVPALVGVSLDIGAGEILGVAGVAGNGQRELAEVTTGLRRAESGTVKIGDEVLTNRSPAEIAAAGVAHIPEDRLADGLVAGMDVAGNAILRDYARPPIAKGPFLAPRAIADYTDRLINEYDVKTPSRKTRLGLLSGGNQQKLLLARELSGEPRLIVA